MYGQVSGYASGYVLSGYSNEPISGGVITLEGGLNSTKTDDKGFFSISMDNPGDFILSITASGYVSKRIPIFYEGNHIDLGNIVLDKDIEFDKTDNLVTLTDTEFSEEENSMVTVGLLQATKDIFLRRAAFDFGQAFFRVRGYDSRNGTVMINGLPMNKLFDGRPQWNNWGGLNDVTRNQQFSNGLNASDYTFGGILGNTNIDTRPSGLRPGFRFSASASNRTYTGRIMATYTSPKQNNGLSYTISSSRRWATEGFIDGTLFMGRSNINLMLKIV